METIVVAIRESKYWTRNFHIRKARWYLYMAEIITWEEGIPVTGIIKEEHLGKSIKIDKNKGKV